LVLYMPTYTMSTANHTNQFSISLPRLHRLGDEAERHRRRVEEGQRRVGVVEQGGAEYGRTRRAAASSHASVRRGTRDTWS